MSKNYLSLSRPDTTATVDLLDVNASITIVHADSKIEINIKQSESEDSSYFTEKDFTFHLQESDESPPIMSDSEIVDYLASIWNSKTDGAHLMGRWFANVTGSFRDAVNARKNKV